MSTPPVSGLALSIRKAVESETFDLGGQNVTTITNTISAAFAEPLPLQEMIRITFVTGAGKLGRQKYDEGAAKAVTSTLRELGYEEDRGASCVIECAGSFKQQHDTGKNLKTVVVFPKVVGGTSSDAGAGTAEGMMQNLAIGNGEEGSILEESSPEHSIAFSSMSVFQGMVKSKMATWAQKKACISAIAFIKTKLSQTEEKLMSGTPLTDPEQTFYDSVSSSSLDEKQAFVKEQMQAQVNDGKLTSTELKTLLEQVTDRLANLAQDKEQAEKEKKPKRIQNLTNMTIKAEERKAKLEKLTAKSPPPLKHEAQISKLRKELEPLLEIEEAGKGRLLSIKETQGLSRRDEILKQIEQLEIASRGWFEEDEAFEARVQISKSAWRAKTKQSTLKKKPAASSATKSAWSTPASRKKTTTGGAKSTAGKSKAKKGSGSVFSAMMMDSDSD